jgi:cytidine diphosphoramidate kinase
MIQNNSELKTETQIRPGKLYWITGLSGAGKSTLARPLVDRLRLVGRATVYLDGDIMRNVFGSSGYTREERLDLAWRYSRLSQELTTQGLDVVCATISLFHEIQAWNRKQIPEYIEVLLDTPFEILQKRNPKKLYSRAFAGEISDVVGVDILPEWPKTPDLILTYQSKQSQEESFETFLCKLRELESLQKR